jgi:uncharacterized membrane protein YwaF
MNLITALIILACGFFLLATFRVKEPERFAWIPAGYAMLTAALLASVAA